MELIKQQDPDLRERPIVLEPAQQDTLGDVQSGAKTGMVFKANLVSDFSTQSTAALPGDSRRHRSRGDAPGLKHHDTFVAGQARIQQHLRGLRGFAGTRRATRTRRSPVVK